MTTEWLTPVLSFLGAGIGAGAVYAAARRDSGQREAQARREEWGRRFTTALGDITSPDPRTREIGRVLLVELARSELASPGERGLAEEMLETGARLDADGTELSVPHQGMLMDEVEFVEDDGADDEGGGR